MPQMKLTKTAIDKLPPCPQGQKLYFDTELHGFGVRVSRTKKSFFVQKAINHNTVRTTFGSYGVLTLEQARKKAQKTIAEMIDGKNPNQIKQDNKHKGLTVSEVHDSYLKAKKHKLKPSTINNYKNACNNYFGDWLDKPMAKITKHKIADRHAHITEHHGAVCANNAMRVIRLLYNYAHVLDESLPENPVNYLSRTNTWNRVDRRKGVVKPGAC